MEKGSIYFTGHYIPDDRIIAHEPAGVYEEPVAPGVAELRVEPLSVVTITPRPMPRRRTRNLIRKAVVLGSAICLPVAFVTLADLLAVSPGLFFGSFAAAFGWPAVVYLANVLRD